MVDIDPGESTTFDDVVVLANLHRTLEWTIRGKRGEKVPKPFDHPGIADGVAGMAFIEAAVASSKQDGEWVEVPKVG